LVGELWVRSYRLQSLPNSQKVNTLTLEKRLELAAITELDEIVRYVNAVNACL
jgi:hypothetical protein